MVYIFAGERRGEGDLPAFETLDRNLNEDALAELPVLAAAFELRVRGLQVKDSGLEQPARSCNWQRQGVGPESEGSGWTKAIAHLGHRQ